MATNNSQSHEDKLLEFERHKFYFDIAKWIIGGFVLVIITNIIDNGFKERSIGIQEMQAFDKYVEIILKADNIEERWKLSEFFSTVTPTDRLKNKWIMYKSVITNDYKVFKELKRKELKLSEQLMENKTIDNLKKLNKVKKELEPFEKRLINIKNSLETKDLTYEINKSTTSMIPKEPQDENVRKFKEKNDKNLSHQKVNTTEQYFYAIHNLSNNVINNLSKELGGAFGTFQSNVDFNYAQSTYSNHLGIRSKLDDTKNILPILQAQFTDDSVIVTMKDNGPPEVYRSPLSSLNWEDVAKFIRAYYTKRLNQLN